MPLEGLASLIYPILRDRVPGDDPRMSYESLVNELGPLPPPNQNLQAFDQRLFAALGAIGSACHMNGLPALSSIVVQQTASSLHMPGPGYYPVTHPEARSDEARIAAWLAEYGNARTTIYPPEL